MPERLHCTGQTANGNVTLEVDRILKTKKLTSTQKTRGGDFTVQGHVHKSEALLYVDQHIVGISVGVFVDVMQ